MEEDNKDITPEVVINDFVDLREAPYTLLELSRETLGMISEKTDEEIYETPKSEEGSTSSSGFPSFYEAFFAWVYSAYMEDSSHTLYLYTQSSSDHGEYEVDGKIVSNLNNKGNELVVGDGVTKIVINPASIPEGARDITDGKETYILVHASWG